MLVLVETMMAQWQKHWQRAEAAAAEATVETVAGTAVAAKLRRLRHNVSCGRCG